MSDERPAEPKSLGRPTLEQASAVYGSMECPSVRAFHAKMVKLGHDMSLSGAQRFIARHINKPQPKPHQTAAIIGNQLTTEKLSLIQKDLAELRPLDVAALKIMFEREVLIYNIMLLRFSQLNADRLSMTPKDSAAMVKSMTEANGKISAVPVPGITPDGQTIDVIPNEPNPVSEAIRQFQREHGLAS